MIKSSISHDTIAATDHYSSYFHPLSDSQLAQETQEWEEGRSEAAAQNEEWGGKEATKRFSVFLFQPLMCRETGERRIEERMERRRTVLWGRCVSRSWGGFISCQRGVSLPANWLWRLKVSEVSERNREAEVPTRWGGRFPRALFTLPSFSFFQPLKGFLSFKI